MADNNVALGLAIAALGKGGGGGGGTPSEYLKSASVSSNTLTLTKKDNTTVTYTPDLSGKQDALTAGSNITISNDVISATDTTYSAATTSTDGLESAADKTKLDSLNVVSGTNDGTNWSTITIGDTTKAIPSGGGTSYTFTDGLTESSGEVGLTWYDGTDSISGGEVVSGTISASGSHGSIAFGQVKYSGKVISNNSQGCLCTGYCESGIIRAQSRGTVAHGYCETSNSWIDSNADGGMAIGYANNGARILTTLDKYGGTARGCACGGYITSSGKGAVASGNTVYEASDPVTASGDGSFAHGEGLTASDAYSTIFGKFEDHTTTSYAFRIANGTDNSNRANAMDLDWSGNVTFAGTVTPSGADYCEYFEFKDGNPDDENRMGYLVTLVDGKYIQFANDGDDIIGICTGSKSVIGDSAEMNWDGKYVRDDFDRIQYEDITVHHDAKVDEETGEIVIPAWDEEIHRPIVSPDFDPTQTYIPRSQRKEWYPVGLLGKIKTRYTGELQAGDYITASNGVAIKSEGKTNMRVLEIVNDHIARVLIK